MATVADQLEGFVSDSVLYRLDTPDLAAALADARRSNAEHDQLANDVADDQVMLDQLAADYADKTISHREWLAARQPIQQRIDSAKRRLSRVSATHRIDDYAGKSELLRDGWADLDLARRQAIVAAVLDYFVVNPAVRGRKTFDTERFTPKWRL